MSHGQPANENMPLIKFMCIILADEVRRLRRTTVTDEKAIDSTKVNLVKHRYSVEKLFHFQCGFCNLWWSIGDWVMTQSIICPHCGVVGLPKMLSNNDNMDVEHE